MIKRMMLWIPMGKRGILHSNKVLPHILRNKPMPLWTLPITIDALNARRKGTIAEHLDIVFTEIGDDFLVARMLVDHRTHQPMGIMHGGASCVLAETVGSVAANCCVDVSRAYCVGLDINTNHIRSIREGYVYGKAAAFHIGKSTQVWGINITNEAGQLISVSRLTMAVLPKA